ncbi:hypothetical protein O5O45_31475 [Hahella aquimaris]|uniref:hypothetical protein n=1 Tax=Hahella sp. HNIBRBA332 TaxID=3015983 RepID=UPI00273B838A|nr:hypothetical protein [Hahella sp. HNIBRBA332]WLQ14241.1 hypothetical protein O5O45_31475 [Hahella sp. HNIBRBA332]
MRFVDNTFLETPANWDQRAQTATNDLINGTIEADDRADVWRCLKDSLADISCDRCWYCETGIPRTDNAVDHYRPKGKVKGVRLKTPEKTLENYTIQPEHLGYKWAAYKLDNFRFSCQHCNEWRKSLRGSAGGKTSYFPLVNEPDRAYDVLDQDNEIPALLDPCDVLDWTLLSFDKSGRPFSRFPEGSEEDLRVQLSILIYHLDQQSINSSRAAQWSQVQPIVEDTKKWFLKRLRGDQGADASFRRELKKLRHWFNPKNKNTYLGFLVYQLKQEQELDTENLHSWIGELLRGLG